MHFLFIHLQIGYAELVEALQRLQGQLNKQGFASLAGRVTAAQSCLLGPAVARALHIRAAVLQRRRPRTQNPVCSNAQALARDVSFAISCAINFQNSILQQNFSLLSPSLLNRWRSQVPKMPLNCVIYCRHMKWKDCFWHTIASQP